MQLGHEVRLDELIDGRCGGEGEIGGLVGGLGFVFVPQRGVDEVGVVFVGGGMGYFVGGLGRTGAPPKGVQGRASPHTHQPPRMGVQVPPLGLHFPVHGPEAVGLVDGKAGFGGDCEAGFGFGGFLPNDGFLGAL